MNAMNATTAAAILAELDIITRTYAPEWNHGRPFGWTFDDFGDQFAIVDTSKLTDRVVRIVYEDELINVANEEACGPGWTVYEKTTARQLLKLHHYISPEQLAEMDEDDREEADWIVKLAEEHGWDTDLYRADVTFGEGEYQTTPITELDAAIDWIENKDPVLGFQVRRCRWMTDEELAAYFYEEENEE